MRFSLVLAALAVSTVAFGQSDFPFQIGYAANLNVGDSILNLSNDGNLQGPFGVLAPGLAPTFGNICANVYVFDPQEEEIGCCACLVTPNGLNSLSAKADLTSDNLTAAVPTSIIIKVLGSRPAETGAALTSPFTVCNPASVGATTTTALFSGMLAWGTTLEPSSTPGTYSPVDVPYLIGSLAPGSLTNPPAVGSEVYGLTQLCNFIQSNGTGYGICKSCRLGALGGSKQ